MRWLFLLLTLLSGAVAFTTHSPGLLGMAILAMVLFGLLTVLGFAQARIEASSQSHTTVLTSRDVQVLRQQGLQKKVANNKSHQRGGVAGSGAGYVDAGGSQKSQFDHGGDAAGDGGGSD
jgi:hypothetical protein